MYLLLFELPTNRTGVWFSGHMAGNAGFFLGVPFDGPFFVAGVVGGVGGGAAGDGGTAFAAGSSLAGSLGLGMLSLCVSYEVGFPSVAGMGVGVLP